MRRDAGKAGFAHVLYLQVPGLAHAIPSADWLEKALEFLSAPVSKGQ